MHPPEPNASPGEPAASTRQSWRNVLIQVLGFGVGVAALWWCLDKALSKDNRDQLQKLADAQAWQWAALIGLSLARLVADGLIFWLALRPVQRLRPLDVVATNFVTAFLTYLPFKLSVVFRVAVHTRRDRVPLLTIGSWFAACAVTLVATLGVLALVALARRGHTLDLTWIAMALGGLALVWALIVGSAKFFAGPKGLARVRSMASVIKVGPVTRFVAGKRFENLHAGADMLASGPAVAGCLALRVADIALQAARFPLAAAVLGLSIGYSDAFLVASAGFLVAILNPGGPMGSREWVIAKVCEMIQLPNAEKFVAVALLVAATEALAYLIGAGLGLAWLRPTRLFRPRGVGSAEPAA